MYYESEDPLFSDNDLKRIIEHREIKCIWLTGTSVTDNGIEMLSRQNIIEEVILDGSLFSNESLRYLSRCTHLTAISLYNAPRINDDGLALLCNETLESLHVIGASVTGSFCSKNERRWPLLRSLTLENTPVDDQHLSIILGGRNLETLGLSGSHISFDGASFSAMHRLRSIGLGGTAITDIGIRNVVELFPFLRQIDLSRTMISDASVNELAKLSLLEELIINETKVSSNGLVYMSNHENIYTIYAEGCQISKRCISTLKTTCPNLDGIRT